MAIKDKLPEAIQDQLDERQQGKNYRQLALQTLVDLLQSSDDKVRLQAAQQLLALYGDDGSPLKKLKDLIT